MEPSADDVLASLERQVRDAAERADKAKAFRQQVDRMRGTAEVDGVRVAVDVTGALVDVALPTQLQYRDSRDLSASILHAARLAHSNASQIAQEAAAEAFGRDSGIAEHFRDELEARARVLRGGGQAS